MEYKYTGIILSKRNVGETDRIYTIYTLELGKIRVMAKSVRLPKAKLAPFLEPITQAEIFLARTKGLGKITGVIATNNFTQIKADLESLQQVMSVFKIMERIISDEEGDKKTFSLLGEYLETIEKIAAKENQLNKKNILTLGFLFKFLGELGYLIEANKCVSCQKKLQPRENYFSAPLGGVLCATCAQKEGMKMKIGDDTIKIMRIFFKNRITNFTKLDVSEKNVAQLKNIFQDFLRWIFTEAGVAKKRFL